MHKEVFTLTEDYYYYITLNITKCLWKVVYGDSGILHLRC